MTGLVSILLDAMSAVGLCCCDSPLRLRRCAPVTLDAPGQSEGEIPREGPAPLRQAPCWPIRGREGDIQSPPSRRDALCWTSHDSDDSCAKGEAGAFASVKM